MKVKEHDGGALLQQHLLKQCITQFYGLSVQETSDVEWTQSRAEGELFTSSPRVLSKSNLT